MTDHRARYGPHNPGETYVAHEIAEQLVDLGEIEMNYATVGDARRPRCCSSRARPSRGGATRRPCRGSPSTSRCSPSTCAGRAAAPGRPGRYTLDNMGNDLVRFIDLVIGRPDDRERPLVGRRPLRVAVGVRQARPGRRRALRGPAAVRVGGAAGHRSRDPPVHRPAVRPLEHLPRRPVVDRRVGRDARAAPRAGCPSTCGSSRSPDEPPQNLKEYDPEWGRSFWTGTVAASCDHERMLRERQGAARCCSRTTSASSTRTPAS